MASLNSLKWELRQKLSATTTYDRQPLSDTQYSAGFDILLQSSGQTIYQEFIIPQLSSLLSPLFHSRPHVSVLEIGPGSKSVLGSLPGGLRRKITKYAAFEPNQLFATGLEDWLRSTSRTGFPLPCLGGPPDIRRIPFPSDSVTLCGDAEKFDVVLFCHSMYGMQPNKRNVIERALERLMVRPEGGLVVVFHRDGTLQLDGLTCHRTASFPTGVIDVADNNEALDCFAPFIAGSVVQDVNANKSIQVEWREVCRALGGRSETQSGRLLFSSPNIMLAFTRHATTVPELTTQVPLARGEVRVKNREARLHRPASIMRPTEIQHIQLCVRWALHHDTSLTVFGGGHSGHCMRHNVVSIDMDAFSSIHILEGAPTNFDSDSLIVVGAGCKSVDIVRKTTAAGLVVPLGSRPSVGAGLWLQGGIGHLTRLHGLACDAIVGAVLVSVASSEVLCIGHVPSEHRPADAVRPENEDDLLWGIKGAGTNFGIVVSVTFKAYTAPIYSIRNWLLPLSNDLDARLKLNDFSAFVAAELPRNCSTDAYLYWDVDKLHLGVTMFESSTAPEEATPAPSPALAHLRSMLGPENDLSTLDSIGLFESHLYVSKMHGGHGGGKTSSFKRCLFLKHVGGSDVNDILVAAIETRPSPLCYFHLLHGGGAVRDAAYDATAFGCRDWDLACVITGVWPRNQDGTEVERTVVQWVYDVARDLLPFSKGAYGADLGPDPRDAALAVKAFGANRHRLIRLKHRWDPSNVLAHACPLLEEPRKLKLIVLVTGESCAGKDYCAAIWASMFNTCNGKRLKACSASISDTTKQDYAASTGADLSRLLLDRAYKEQHRSALSAYFQDQIRNRPSLPVDHFLDVVHDATDVDVLFVTGMRDEAPVAALSHLVPGTRLLEVRVKASKDTRDTRRRCQGSDDGKDANKLDSDRPSLIFNNETSGDHSAKRFFEDYLFPFFDEDIERLASMVRSVASFPRPDVEFRHVLDISQQPGGLALCTTLLHKHFIGTWKNVTAVACCEVGGFIYASALAARVNVPLALIREAGKLPPPTISVVKSPSHISSSASTGRRDKRVELGRDVVSRDASVLVVDDVLATGETLCAILQLLGEAGIAAEDVNVMVVAEFPFHRGRELLRRRGFGRVNIQSLLVFGGA